MNSSLRVKKRNKSYRIKRLLASFENRDFQKNYVYKNYSKTVKNKKPITQFEYYLDNNPVIIGGNELLVGGIFLRFKDIKIDLTPGNIQKRVTRTGGRRGSPIRLTFP